MPAILELLALRGLAATFFVEGLNAQLYPDLLGRIDSEGHEIAYHAWTHEQWAGLSPAGQAENLARGREAFAGIGLDICGLRPPGGALGVGGVEVVRKAGLRYCSPAGAGIGYRAPTGPAASVKAGGGVVLLPFGWQHVDATCVLPPLGSIREQMTGSRAAVEPARFLSHLEGEIDRLAAEGGFATIVLHPFMLDWLGAERLEALLDRLAAAATGDELWVAPFRDVADRILADPGTVDFSIELDQTTWSE